MGPSFNDVPNKFLLLQGLESSELFWLGSSEADRLIEVLIVSILINAQASHSKTQKPRCAHLGFDCGVLVMLLTMFFTLFFFSPGGSFRD